MPWWEGGEEEKGRRCYGSKIHPTKQFGVGNLDTTSEKRKEAGNVAKVWKPKGENGPGTFLVQILIGASKSKVGHDE